MQKCKRWLASLLSVLMLVSALPTAAMAESMASENTVIYNLLDREVAVGSDRLKLVSGKLDALFDKDGDYTIILEDNALFPYEVQFTWGGETWVEWFLSPDDTVEIGGHTFRVFSERTDPEALVQLGFYVGSDFVLAYPEAKRFHNRGKSDADVFSMLPLREKRLDLDLTGYFPGELKEFSVCALASMMGVTQSVSAWAKWGYRDENGTYVSRTDNYVYVVGEDATINLLGDNIYSDSFYVELIVGSGDQLDSDNIRYRVDITYGLSQYFLDPSVYTTDDPRVEIDFSSYISTYRNKYYLMVYVDGYNWEYGQDAYLSLNVLKSFQRDGMLATVYEGYFEKEEDIPEDAVDISSKIWNQQNLAAEGGYLANFTGSWYSEESPAITIILKQGEKTLLMQPLYLELAPIGMNLDYSGRIYADNEDGSGRNEISYTYDYLWNSETSQYEYEIELDNGYPANGTYYCNLQIYSPKEDTSDDNGLSMVKKAVVGSYWSEEEIPEDAEDIKEQLFSNAYAADGGYGTDYSDGVTFTVVDIEGGIHQITILTKEYDISLTLRCESYLYADGKSTYYRDYASNDYSINRASKDYPEYVFTLNNGYSANETYYGNLYFYHSKEGYLSENGLSYVKKAVAGYYASEDEIPETAEDIKEHLFSDAQMVGSGYGADYSEGIVFTVVDVDGLIYHAAIKVEDNGNNGNIPTAARPLSQDTYFHMWGADEAEDNNNGSIYCYVMPYDSDSYYYNGYQTVFLLNRVYDSSIGEYVYSPVTDATIIPRFSTGNKVDAYAGHNGSSGVKQISGETPVEFVHGKPILYSAAAENHENLKNYWVTFLTQQSGPELYINAANDPDRCIEDEDGTMIPQREVLLTEQYGNIHEIFFANVGDKDIEGMYVRLENAENIALDEYWTIRENAKATTLKAFTTTQNYDPDGNYTSYGEIPNVGKIRLLPAKDENGNVLEGVVSGTLVIGYTGSKGEDGEEIRIDLTGIAGTPRIVTTSVVDGVKYVPYSSVIQTNNMYGDNSSKFSLISGELPAGLEVKPNGEIYGVPQETGEFTFTVKMIYKDNELLTDTAEYTLTILDNTDENVWNATDEDYEVTDYIGTKGETDYSFILNAYQDENFWSEGEFGYFIDLWMDGKKLVAGVDYYAEEGSTRITIYEETFAEAGEGSHTISAEFREGDSENGSLKKAAQNYTVDLKTQGNPDVPNEPDIPDQPDVPTWPEVPNIPEMPQKPEQPEKPETPQVPAHEVFSDVVRGDWFYGDVAWAYENDLMIGVGESLFAPNAPISQAMVVTTLGRMSGVDPEKYAAVELDEVTSGQWYSEFAAWARTEGILTEDAFSAEPPLERGHFARILCNYLRYAGVELNAADHGIEFADAEDMTTEENEAFQLLYHYGIFNGVGNGRMDPKGATNRAQLAALLHRISVLIETMG